MMRLVLYLLLATAALAQRADVLVVLGCQNEAELGARVEAAARAIREAGAHRAPLVVLSGGAKYRGGTEASVLAGRLARRLHGRAVRMLEENDSLDTVGNALFTAYLLRPATFRTVAVVTSDFHTDRSRQYFERVLPPGTRVIAIGAKPGPRTDVEIARRAAHEKASLTRSMAELFDAPPPLPRGALDELLVRLVERHPYYRGRGDLLRRHRIVNAGQLTAPAALAH